MTIIKQREVTDILTWHESKRVANFVHNQGIEQFINIYNQYANRDGDSFKWGDEVWTHFAQLDTKSLSIFNLIEFISKLIFPAFGKFQ